MRKIEYFLLFLLVCTASLGVTPGTDQDEYEKSIDAVVRNKQFYKTGRFEISASAGMMPYDSLVSHYMAGGHVVWHLSDHYAWEIIDAEMTFPSITGFTTNLVKDKKISNLQTPKLKILASTNFVVSPLYGKLRLFGHSVIHMDLYLLAGLGFANTEIVRVGITPAAAAAGMEPTQAIIRTSWDPMIDFGIGFKIFLNRAIGVVIDLRDYIVYTELYGSKTLQSNFSVYLGISFFLPTFG